MSLGALLSQLLGSNIPSGIAPDAVVAPPGSANPGVPMSASAPSSVPNPSPLATLAGSGTPQQAPVSAPPTDSSPAPNPDGGFTPKHTSLLGSLADIFLFHGPHFHNITMRENNIAAMKDFQNDPMAAIQKVAQYNPTAAYQMWNTYHDNLNQDKMLQMKQNDITLGRGIGLLSTATPENYDAIKNRINQYFQSQKFDPGIPLPDKYDPAAIQGFKESALDSKSQLDYEMMNNYRAARAQQFQEQITNNANYRSADLGLKSQAINNTQSYRQQRLQQIQAQQGMMAKHYQNMDQKGLPAVGQRELSPDRTVLRQFQADGQWHIYKKMNGKVQEVGVLAPQKQSGTKYNPDAYAETPMNDEGDDDQ